MVKDEDELKDVCQEVFIKVYMKVSGFTFQSKLSTWIATIAYRTGLNYIKKQKQHIGDTIDDEALNATTHENNPYQQMENEDTKQYIHNLIETLPVHYKVILTLYHLEEYNYQEIGEITALPEGTVKNYLFRARKLLKEKLKQKQNRHLLNSINTNYE